MATTGTYLFDPDLAECLDEAFERAGFGVEAIERKHIQSAQRSAKFMLNGEWLTLGVRQWMIQQETVNLTPGQSTFTMPVGAIDIFDMTFKRNNVETEVAAIARDVYFTKHKKTLRGRVIEFMVDKSATAKTVYLWPCGEITGDQLLYNFMRQMQDPGSIGNTLQLPGHAREAFVSGMAMHIALKFMPSRYATLRDYYRGPDPNKIGGQLKMMVDEDREDVELVVQVDYTGPRQGSW
jgi:hypothetical protein